MSIKRKSRIGGIVIVSTIAATMLVATFGVNHIRFGGSIYVEDRLLSDLVADVLPPPQFAVEPFAEASMMLRDPSDFTTHRARLKTMEEAYRQRNAYWAESALDSNLKDALRTKAEAGADAIWNEINNRSIPAVERGDREAMLASAQRLEDLYEEHNAGVNSLVAQVNEHRQEVAASSQSALTIISTLLLAFAVAIVAMVMGALRYANRQALDPLARTAETMSRMAAGDLEVGRTINHRDDEIGEMTRAIEVFREASQQRIAAQEKQRAVVEAIGTGLTELGGGNLGYRISQPLADEYEALRASFNATLDQLGGVMQSVTASARSVSTGASEIRAASDDLALRNEQQAASLEETAAAMNQVTGIVRESAGSAAEVRRSIGEAHHEATEGGAVVQRAISAMGAIERSSQEINQIINVIDGIAFKTNLLALNAGVEAARAGDAGKGFAVVANEVRALAQRSADAAKDIKQLITTSSGQVGEGVTLVGETGALLERIVTRVGEVSSLMQEIAQSAENQASNLQQVNTAVGEMDRMTQQNAAMVEESTAAARSLADEAAELTRLVAHFRTGAEAAQAQPAAIRMPLFRKSAAPMPATHGNLALKSTGSDEDWTEF